MEKDGERQRRPSRRDRKSGSAGMPRPISYAVFCLIKKTDIEFTSTGDSWDMHTTITKQAYREIDAIWYRGCGGSDAMYQQMQTQSFFFFNDTATTEIYTLSIHDALPIWPLPLAVLEALAGAGLPVLLAFLLARVADRKSTRLNSSHPSISYAVFCLKKKKQHSNSHLLTKKKKTKTKQKI